MKKVFLSFLTLLLFASYGMTQTGDSSTLDETNQKRSRAVTPVSKEIKTQVNKAITQDQSSFILDESIQESAKTAPLLKNVAASNEISIEERSYINNLKSTNVEEYKEYLRTKSDIKSLENSLANSEGMDETKKNQLSIKLEDLKSKYDFK